jgi:hypothetical protein
VAIRQTGAINRERETTSLVRHESELLISDGERVKLIFRRIMIINIKNIGDRHPSEPNAIPVLLHFNFS